MNTLPMNRPFGSSKFKAQSSKRRPRPRPSSSSSNPGSRFPGAATVWLSAVVLVGVLLGSGFGPALHAQTATTAGTSLRSADGRTWAYLTWNSDQPEFLQRAVIALFRKDGSPDSPGDYRLVSVLKRDPETAVIRAALQRAQQIGENLDMVGDLVQSAFAELVPAPTLPLEEKLQVIFATAQARPDTDRLLQFLTRTQPALALAAGQAFAVEIPSGVPTTFELRVCDRIPTDAGLECTTVMGRVTVTGGSFAPLPAPGIPTDVSWRGPRGDLNVRLLWATPNALRAEVMLQAGFQVYRVTPAHYAAHFASRAPEPGELARLSQTTPAAVARVNLQPVYPNERFNDTEVQAFRFRRQAEDGTTDHPDLNPIPYFTVDDNHRFEPGGRPFQDGDSFYYYVVARDLLGREGLPSPPALITICGRRAPVSPKEVTVEIASLFNPVAPGPEKRDQFFNVRWARNPTNQEAVPTDVYWVYRWNSPEEVVTPPVAGAPPKLPFKTIPAGDRRSLFYEAADDGAGRPLLPDADQKTYWYTVRAVRQAPCGDDLVSGHSPPVPGVLRGWEGPGRVDGELTVLCHVPRAEFVSWTPQAVAVPPPGIHVLELVCHREAGDRATAWAEYYLATQDQPDPTGAGLAGDRYLGRVWFERESLTATLGARIPRTVATSVRLRCRVGSDQGTVSPPADGVLTPLDGKWPKAQVVFRSVPVPAVRAVLGTCGSGRHLTRHPETGRLEPIGVTVRYTDTTREHRIYLSIDNGPLELVARGSGPRSAVIQETIESIPGNAATLCFYVQNLDSQGLAGPMTFLGCVMAEGQQEMPVPLLAKPTPATTPDGRFTVATLKWFCPLFAVERFRVLVHTEDSALLPARISTALYESPATWVELVGGKSYRVYETGRVGGNFGATGDPNFTLALEVQASVKYEFLVQAAGRPDDFGLSELGGFSQPVELQWSLPAAVGDDAVAWPARGLGLAQSYVAGSPVPTVRPPPGDALYTPAVWTDPGSSQLHLGVLIGTTPGTPLTDPQSGAATLEGVVDPRDMVGLVEEADPTLRASVLPCVLYRYQVANEAFPAVSGDVIQVSPLLRTIAHRTVGTPEARRTALVDPFIDVKAELIAGVAVVRIYLKDTQPAVQGATYRYVMVRFTELGEVAGITHTSPVTIP